MILEGLRERWWKRVVENRLESEATVVKVKGLKPEEAIGKPTRSGYPLLRGREMMIQAEVKGALGQAFTDQPSDFVGSLASLYAMPLRTNRKRALLIAAINATYRYLGLATGSRHCRDDAPERCGEKIAAKLASYLSRGSRIAVIGFQPAIVHCLSKSFENLRVTDMNPDNIGKRKEGVVIESHRSNRDVAAWSDAVIATGSTLSNGSIDDIMRWSWGKPLYFYGVTISAAAYEFGLERFCFEAE